jgi:hypothetical protein
MLPSSFLFYIFLLLVGNIESNPGPESAYISSTPPSAVVILSDKPISICNINIRSIRNKINFLQNFVDEFDIIVLTETHLDNSIENRVSNSIHLIKILNEKIVLILVAGYLFTQRKTSAFAGDRNLKMT